MKKTLICCLVAIMILTTCAYAAEEDTDVSDIPQTDEYIILADSRDPDVAEESGDTGDPDPAGADPDEDGEHADEGVVLTEEPEPTPELEYNPAINEDGVTASLGDDMDVDVTPTPEPTPEPEEMTYNDEVLTTLGNIQGMLIFFTVVLLCYFSYKFFRMFF